MSKWYGLGGHWINIGLPMYVAMDRKPVNGCEIQNVCCGRSRIMMQIKIVETAEEEQQNIQEDEEGMLHGVSVLFKLLDPWKNDGERVVCADSYFASVSAVDELKKHGFRFIGVVKTATKQFPLAYLQGLELTGRGDSRALLSRNEDNEIDCLAILWVDRDRRYFVANAVGLDEAEPIFRVRWRQADTTPNAEPERQELTIAQPAVVKTYYDVCSAIDRHNKQRQDDLEIERIVKTKDWSKRVNLFIFGMCLVDTCNFHQACVHQRDIDEDPDTFYSKLAEEMIDNNLSGRNRPLRRAAAVPGTPAPVRANVTSPSAHLTPTESKRRKKSGEMTPFSLQGRCRVCHKKTSLVCAACDQERLENGDAQVPWFCGSKTARSCFEQHRAEKH